MGKLERIKKEYLEVKDNVSATEFIKSKLKGEDGEVILNPGEAYYLCYVLGDKDPNLMNMYYTDNDKELIVSYDNYDEYCSVHEYVTKDKKEYRDECCELFMAADINGIIEKLNMGLDSRLFIMDYSFPIKKEMIKHYLVDDEYKDDVILTRSYVTTEAFNPYEYYCSYMGMNPEDDKEDVPYKEVLDINCEALEELGFVSINDFIGYENNVAYIYPNKAGKKIIEYINNLKKEEEKQWRR